MAVEAPPANAGSMAEPNSYGCEDSDLTLAEVADGAEVPFETGWYGADGEG
jgi:hypothetical protein